MTKEPLYWCSFRDLIDKSVCWEQAEFVVTDPDRRVLGEVRACGRHLADVMMTGNLEPPWRVNPA